MVAVIEGFHCNAFRKINQIITSKSYSPSSPIVYKVNPAPQRDEILSEASTHYSKKNTDRRDKRKDTTIKKLRTQSHNDRTQIDVLSKALETKNKELEVNVSALQETKAAHELLQSQNQLLKKKVACLSDELAFSQTQQQTIEKIIDEKEELQCIVHELQGELKGTYRGSSKKLEKIYVARWDYAIHKSSFSELSYVAFSQNSLSNSPRFASLA